MPPPVPVMEASIPLFDFHTHRLDAPPGQAVVSLSEEIVASPQLFRPTGPVACSVGVHPWWCGEGDERLWEGVVALSVHPQVVAIGECGFDRLRGALSRQREMFVRHIRLSEELRLPLVVHCVRAFDLLLAARKELRPTLPWTVHGFRGKPALARQLLAAGLDLSFGPRFNPESVRLCPSSRLHIETDDTDVPIESVRNAIIRTKQGPLPQ